ncbi:DUF4249 family protein [Balneolales bacterium ANBcel1]|nr:DUF4249 family protein [Balneolales bacterium ANBcel1]
MYTSSIPRLLLLITLVALFSSCDVYNMEPYENEYFVEGFLVAGEPFNRVQLSKTAAFDEEYTKSDSRVCGADVTIFRLDSDGNRADSYILSESGTGYYTVDGELIPQPRQTYELEVITPDQVTLRAFTTVPDTFRIVRFEENSAVYLSDEQIEVTLSRSWFPGRQNMFIFETRALAPDDYPMTPYYHTNNSSNRSARQRQTSKILSEANFVRNHDETVTIRYPWSEISWFGPSRVTIHAIDDNVYDYYRSQYVQAGGSTLIPGQVEHTITNVKGGRGLFGSLSSVTFEIYVENPEPLDE